MRSHNDIVEISFQMLKIKVPNDTKGQKSIPIMISFIHFDLVNGFITDWVHGSLLGVTKLLLDIWLGTHKLCFTDEEKKDHHFCGLSTKTRLELNKRMMELKPYY